MRRARPALLPALADGQPHLRRQRRRLLAGARLPGARAALAARLAWNGGRGLRHLCAVPAVLAEEAGEGWRDGLDWKANSFALVAGEGVGCGRWDEMMMVGIVN